MPIKLLSQQIVYKNPAFYCGPGPSVVCDEGGKLTVVFRRVRSWLADGHMGHWHPGTETCLTRSADEGQTWSAPQGFLAGYQCPDLTRLRDGTLVLSTHRMDLVPEEIRDACPDVRGVMQTPWPGIHAGTSIWRSEDDGMSWSEPVDLHGVPDIASLHPSLPIPVAVRGNVVEMRSGRLFVSAYDLPAPNTAHLFASDDGARSWDYVGSIAEGFNETYLIESAAGELLAFLRGWEEDNTFLSRSVDGGLTWSTPEPICKGYPACALGLADGRILVVYGYRFAGEYGVRACLLSAGGNRLMDEPECVLRDDGATFDLGYPKICAMPDGHLYVVYYINRKVDAPDAAAPRYIEGCVLTVT